MKLAEPTDAKVFYLDPDTLRWTRTTKAVRLPAGWVVQYLPEEKD